MKEPEIINYNGKSIFYMDFTDLKDEKVIKQIIDKSIEFIRIRPNESVLSLTNLQGMHFNSTIKDLFSKFISGNKPFIKASAVVGAIRTTTGNLQRGNENHRQKYSLI